MLIFLSGLVNALPATSARHRTYESDLTARGPRLPKGGAGRAVVAWYGVGGGGGISWVWDRGELRWVGAG